jgi:hypothetical protein
MGFGLAEIVIFLVTTFSTNFFGGLTGAAGGPLGLGLAAFLAADFAYLLWKLFNRLGGGEIVFDWGGMLWMGGYAAVGAIIGGFMGAGVGYEYLAPIAGGIGAVIGWNTKVM